MYGVQNFIEQYSTVELLVQGVPNYTAVPLGTTVVSFNSETGALVLSDNVTLDNNAYLTFGGVAKLWKHYDTSVNRGNFYGKDNNTSITFLFNPNVSLVKNFNTVSYEGSNGFQVTSFASGFTGEDEFDSTYSQVQDTSNVVGSYESGEYVINPADGQAVIRSDYQTTFGTTNPALNRYHAGFDRKENKYVAYLVNNSIAT